MVFTAKHCDHYAVPPTAHFGHVVQHNSPKMSNSWISPWSKHKIPMNSNSHRPWLKCCLLHFCAVLWHYGMVKVHNHDPWVPHGKYAIDIGIMREKRRSTLSIHRRIPGTFFVVRVPMQSPKLKLHIPKVANSQCPSSSAYGSTAIDYWLFIEKYLACQSNILITDWWTFKRVVFYATTSIFTNHHALT